jgi:hypothetical protein
VGLSNSGLTGSGLTYSGLTGSGLTGSGLTSSGLTSSGFTGSGFTGSGFTGSGRAYQFNPVSFGLKPMNFSLGLLQIHLHCDDLDVNSENKFWKKTLLKKGDKKSTSLNKILKNSYTHEQ